MAALGKQMEVELKSGRMLGSGGLTPTSLGSRVQLAAGKLTVVDGPFTEAKEIIGGYALFEFPTKEHAVKSAVQFMELHKEHWPAWEGVTEVREIVSHEQAVSRS
jgi:hypothetical protein